MHGMHRRVLLQLLGSLLAAAPGAAAAELLHSGLMMKSVLLPGVPHVPQRPDFCGEACAAMWLGKLGHGGSQDWVFEQTGLDPLEGRGAYTRELAQALRHIGFQPGPVWHKVRAGDAAQLQAQLQALHADLLRGVPSIVCMRYDASPDASEHFRLILGYDAARDQLIYHEPAEAAGAYRRMGRELFLSLWPLKYDRAEWTVIRLALQGAELRPAAPSSGIQKAAYAQHLLKLRPSLPAGFTVVLSPPFVVIGDGPPAQVRRAAEGTVAWAVSRLKASYFPADPDEILDIWLFKDAASYERHCEARFGERPDTPYGYYSPEHKALIMNIATGGGTLVHEIVHPYVRKNFPSAPAWLNEGLGSLYEQSSERDGRIVGLTNWRLSGLQEAIRARGVPPFRSLMAASDREFYRGKHSPTGYAQSRYLLYYLQERGLLQEFYHRFHRARRSDPTGFGTLQELLGEADMTAFQRRWEAWVLTLRFEG